ncbi:MAG: hemerythrin family protein [Planctomycetota bacterium]|jgi:hemerythrin|nr:hemerythrin family protein [Planctomycetota bacterium]
MAYTWDAVLETGNELIDRQHQELIIAINNLLDACNNGKGRDAAESTLEFMVNYALKHLRDEEELQVRHQYPHYAGHKKMHDHFKRAIAEIVLHFRENGTTVALVGKLNISIGEWLTNHIKNEDARLARYIVSR